MKLDFGSNSHMYFNLDLKGLPDIDKTEVHFNLVNAKLNWKTLIPLFCQTVILSIFLLLLAQ